MKHKNVRTNMCVFTAPDAHMRRQCQSLGNRSEEEEDIIIIIIIIKRISRAPIYRIMWERRALYNNTINTHPHTYPTHPLPLPTHNIHMDVGRRIGTTVKKTV